MKTTYSYLAQSVLLLSALFAVIQSHAASIIVNGDFELGNTGFATSYRFSSTRILGASQYTVTDNPPAAHPGAPPYGDHTSGTGLMMMANGATSPINVWSQSVSLTPSTLYEVSGFVSSWQGNPARLDVRVDGTSLGVAVAPSVLGIWEGFSFLFDSGASTSATISIVDLNTSASGNDFALDDLSLSQIPIPPALYLFGSGMLGLVGIARRRKAV